MQPLTKLLLLLCLISVLSVADEKDRKNSHPLWNGLKAGPFSVGFRSSSTYDARRPAFRDDYGDLSKGQQGRFVQMNVWYPAIAQDGMTAFSFMDYVYLRGYETSVDITEEEARQKARERFLKYLAIVPEELDVFLEKRIPVAAFMNAEPAKGRFPLVLLAHGSAVDWCVLAEYLASHGFVVAHAPATGTFEKALDVRLSGVETEIRDLEFIMGRTRELTFVEGNTIAAIGYSFGAMSAAGLRTRHPDVRAIVSLDGGIGSDWGGYILSETPYYDTTRLNVPILHLYSNRVPGADLRWFDDYKYSSRYLVGFSQMRHSDFIVHAVLEQFLPGIQEEPPYGDATAGYEWVCRYTLHFLKAYLTNDSDSTAFLKQSPESNGIAVGLLTIDHRPALALPPDETELVRLLESDGFGAVLSLYTKFREDDDQPLPHATFHAVWRHMTEKEQFENAETWASMFLEAYPKSAGAHVRVASTANRLGQPARAILYYERALEILPHDPSLDDWYRRYYRESILRSLSELESAVFPYSLDDPPDRPVPFADGKITTSNGISFSPDGRSLFVSLQLKERNAVGRKRSGIFRHDYINGQWSEPKRLRFSMQYTNYQPILSPNGKRLFFTSTRPLPNGDSEARQNVWFVQRTETGWSEPQIVESLITPKWDGHAMTVEGGALYYASERTGGFGAVDIWQSRFTGAEYSPPENVEALNTSDTDNDFFIDPFERYIIFTRYIEAEEDLDLFISFQEEEGWSKPQPLDVINTDDWELSPSVSPDGKYFFFLRDGTIWQIELKYILMPR